MPKRSFPTRPFLDLALVLIAAGLLAAAYVLAERPWPISLAAPSGPPPHAHVEALPPPLSPAV